jgi:hypothetical protein
MQVMGNPRYSKGTPYKEEERGGWIDFQRRSEKKKKNTLKAKESYRMIDNNYLLLVTQ